MSKENGDFLGQVGGFWNQALSKVGDVAQKFADDQIEMARNNAPPQRKTFEKRRSGYERMGGEGGILEEERSSSDGRSSSAASSQTGGNFTRTDSSSSAKSVSGRSQQSNAGVVKNLTRVEERKAPFNSPPKASGESKENQGKSTIYIPNFIKKSFSYCRSCLINPLTFERNTSKNFKEDVETEYKKENSKNPEVKRQDGATKESQTSSSSASIFGSLRERLSNAWRAGVDVKVGVTVTNNGRSQEYSTESKLRPLSKHELTEGAISVANTVIGAAGSSYQAMNNAKKDTLGTAKELAVLLSDSNNTAPSTSFRDLKASAARAMDSLSNTKIPSPDLTTVRGIRESLPSPPSFRGLRASAARAMDSLSETAPSLPTTNEIQSFAASAKASIPSPPSLRGLGASAARAMDSLSETAPRFPTTNGMKQLAASLRPAKGTLKDIRGSLPSPSMPKLPSLPSFRAEIGISFGGSGR